MNNETENKSEIQKWLDLFVEHEAKRTAIDKERAWCMALEEKISAARDWLIMSGSADLYMIKFIETTLALDRVLLAHNRERHLEFDARTKAISDAIEKLKAEADKK